MNDNWFNIYVNTLCGIFFFETIYTITNSNKVILNPLINIISHTLGKSLIILIHTYSYYIKCNCNQWVKFVKNETY